ncbi:translation initiation factor 3 subunit [Cardiosporidium cionae]|uniref:Eukaryotic translation initiation factor 3 subunit G n=1 Tax=Cardiosporidium cionae TaxID=476202 RepID=A0ABQ7JGD0_9APIC|nr:translation initiation factor 3 subunit [Cardiosporidium cionae]|eukprot:KAF8823082.1 translation initiation factor 3 subunit [Cardiosporidium cionae]
MSAFVTKWADVSPEEDDYAPESDGVKVYETKVDNDGIKTVTSYIRNSKGETVKVTKRVRVVKKSQRRNRAIYHRDVLEKFGKAADSNADTSTMAPFALAEEIPIDIPKRAGKIFQQEEDDNDYLNDPQIAKEKRELKNKFKAFRDELSPNDAPKIGDEGRPAKFSDQVAKAVEKYRPLDQTYKDESTVRVTNLSDDTEEADLKLLFGKIGQLQRIFLARDNRSLTSLLVHEREETTTSKGFAFITYQRREDAVKAIRQLNRHGYDNLLLNVEWAKPSNRERY